MEAGTCRRKQRAPARGSSASGRASSSISAIAAAVSSMMAPDAMGAPPVRDHHLGTVELTEICTLQVRVRAYQALLGRGRVRCAAVRRAPDRITVRFRAS